MKSTCHWYSPVKYVVLGINLFCHQGEDVISLHMKQKHVNKDLFVALFFVLFVSDMIFSPTKHQLSRSSYVEMD